MADDKEIVKIIIKGDAGYCCIDDSYEDKLTLKKDEISYEFTPYIGKENKKKIKWRYKTNNPCFEKVFFEIGNNIVRNYFPKQFYMCTDIGGIEFKIFYKDGSKEKKLYFIPSDEFKEVFIKIRQLVPTFENIPEVLKMREDYK